MNTSIHDIWVLLAIIALASAQVWLSHLRLETAKHAQGLHAQILAQQEKIQTLGLEYASLTRPNRLRQLSHTKLGMQPPQPMQVLRP